METYSDDSNGSDTSFNRNSPINFSSKTPCQMSTKASAFSIDALIGRRTLAQKRQAVTTSPTSPASSDAARDYGESDSGDETCRLPTCKRPRVEDGVHLAPLGKNT